MNRRQWIAIIGICFLALMAGAFSSHWFSQNRAVNEEAVKEVFTNEWQSPDGKAINTSAWEGKVLVLNFWASWCPPHALKKCRNWISYKGNFPGKMSYL